MNLQFQPRRIFLLVKRDVHLQFRAFLIVFGALFAMLFIAGATAVLSGASGSANPVFFSLVLFLGGFVFTSFAFSDLNRGRSRAFYLSLPASSLEKFVAKLFITGPGWAAACLVLYFLFSVTVSGLTYLVFGTGYGLFDPLEVEVWKQMRSYLVLQSIFLLGSVSFRGNAFSKTLLVLFAFLVGYLLLVLVMIYLFHWFVSIDGQPYVSFRIFDAVSRKEMSIPTQLRGLSTLLGYGIHILFWYVMAPFLWLVAYFRLKETTA